ncbi:MULTISPECIES: DMT family transporter [unclassified Guyparkeria]|uniref:DMT family transporter n=1 Tax=unclassified Guyparkeria TaxID=2626246 RepID=UPI000826A9B5|nr:MULTISPECIES: DMT family transporter [unclassified Guyparkeria]
MPMGIVLVILAAFLWGVSGGIAAMLMERGWDPLVVSFYRGAIGFACFAVWWLARSNRIRLPDRTTLGWSALAGLGVAGNFVFYFLSISHANVAVAVTLMYMEPIYVYLVLLAIGAARLTPALVIAIAAVILGVALLTQLLGGRPIDELSLFGVVAGLLSGVAYAVFLFGFQNATRRAPSVVVLGVAFAVFLLVLAPLVDHDQVAAAPLSDDVPLFLLLGLFGAGLSFFLYVIGLRTAAPVSVSLVAAVEPVTASLFALLVLGQALALGQWLGMFLILATVTALSVRQRSA